MTHGLCNLITWCQGRPFHRGMDAACVLEKTGGERKSCTFSRKLGGKFYENIRAYSLAQVPQKDTKTLLSCQQFRTPYS